VSLPLLDLVVLAVLLGGLPLATVAQTRVVKRIEIERVPAYWSSIATLVVLGLVAWFVGTRSGGPRALGLRAAPIGPTVAWTVALVVLGLAIVLAFRQGGILFGVRESPMLRALMPRTARERGLFAVLSLAAGVCEEAAYRGYALTTLASVIGAGWAAVATSVVFGVLHAYQGRLGVLRTGSLGGLLATGYLMSGSLWAPMAAHVILDLILGIGLAERMMVPEPDNGVSFPADEGDVPPREEHGSGSGAAR